MFKKINIGYKGNDIVIKPPSEKKELRDLLYKKVLNYPSLGVLRGLDADDLLSVKRHYMVMRDVFFNKPAVLENLKKDSEKFFNVEKWNALRDAAFLSQDYVRNVFFHELNLMRTQQFNKMIKESEVTVNKSLENMDSTYTQWKNSKGHSLFDPISIESMDKSLQEALNKEKDNQEKGVVRTKTTPDPKYIKHYIKII